MNVSRRVTKRKNSIRDVNGIWYIAICNNVLILNNIIVRIKCMYACKRERARERLRKIRKYITEKQKESSRLICDFAITHFADMISLRLLFNELKVDKKFDSLGGGRSRRKLHSLNDPSASSLSLQSDLLAPESPLWAQSYRGSSTGSMVSS